MTIDDVIRDFATTGCDLPRASMQWALDHWDEAAPAFIEVLERYASGADRSEDSQEAVFFVVHLLGEKAEARAFPALCRLMCDADACEAALGDATTENLPAIIVSTYDGNLPALKGVIEDAAADQFVRHGALMAMAYLTRTGRISDAETRAYLLHLYAEMRPQAESFVWAGWVEAVACLGYRDYADQAERLMRRGFVERFVMSIDDFRGDLRQTLDDPDGMAGFALDRVAPFGEAIETLSQWYYFTDAYKKDQARAAARHAVDEKWSALNTGSSQIDQFRHVGRNDPCPCGSGKKYKKCCLVRQSGPIPLPAAQ